MTIDFVLGRQLVSDKYDQIKEWTLDAINYYLSKHKLSWFDSFEKEEVVSAVMVNVLTKAELFDESKSALKTWVKTIARNAMIDRIRAHKDAEKAEYVTDKGDVVMHPGVVEAVGTDNSAEVNEILEVVNLFLAGKSQLDADIMELSIMGYSVKEIADRFGLTPNAVSMRLFKMRKELKPILAA